MMQKRYLTRAVQEDLEEKMVFLGGPRQVGKTTLARELIGITYPWAYYTWDKIADRRTALKGEWPPDKELILLDEFHKNPKWKTWIKGEYDTYKNKYKFLLTGSARLNVYKKGGDSLRGRYHYYRLHPFSVAEAMGLNSGMKPKEEPRFRSVGESSPFATLFEYGGFPEPFIKQNQRHWRRWNEERMEGFFREDIRDLSRIQDLGNLHLLSEILPEKVGSILSINSLSRDLQVNFRTVSHWLDVFEQLFFCYRLLSYQSKKIAAVKKEKKLYLWDWSQVANPASRLENLVASHLLKYCHYLHDYDGMDAQVCYLRDVTGREVDFCVCIDGKPWFAVEVKSGDTSLAPNLLYFSKKLDIPYCYQVTMDGSKDFLKDGIRIMPAQQFLTAFV
ncbi:MAG TPA: AAA family ATPase [Deltaproteobacteria bacterium]|nr:AAA family ATPase [Deltaproteobacteria bacterium]